jgi:lipopolysaccharide transport system permease protein
MNRRPDEKRLLSSFRPWLTKNRMLEEISRQEARLSNLHGGQWNGHGAPNAFSMIHEAWAWRALILEVAFQKTIARYRNFVLGPVWIILGFSLFVFGLSALWARLQHLPFETFLTYVSVGLLAWNIVLGVLADGCRSLTENRNLIHQSRAPLLIYPLVTVLKHVFIAGHNALVVIPVVIIFGPPLESQLLWLVLGFITLLIFSTSVCVALSIIGTYLPDLAEVITSLLRFAFFFTPIFWMPDLRPEMKLVWLLNPFYYAVESIRGPLLHTSDPTFIIPVLAILAAISSLLAMVVFAGGSRGARTRV